MSIIGRVTVAQVVHELVSGRYDGYDKYDRHGYPSTPMHICLGHAVEAVRDKIPADRCNPRVDRSELNLIPT